MGEPGQDPGEAKSHGTFTVHHNLFEQGRVLCLYDGEQYVNDVMCPVHRFLHVRGQVSLDHFIETKVGQIRDTLRDGDEKEC
jgi:hypothetical protein